MHLNTGKWPEESAPNDVIKPCCCMRSLGDKQTTVHRKQMAMQ